MAIFTLAAGALLTAVGVVGASTFVTSLVAGGLALAAGLALNYVAQALSGKPNDTTKQQDHFGAQGVLTAGGDVPRSFGLGLHMTAGSLVYANYWGNSGDTPNAYLTQVIAVSDLPREQLMEIWVQGEKCTLVPAEADPDMGWPLAEYKKDGVNHLWIHYFDGTQTAADPFLAGIVSSVDRPYSYSRIGTGICYVVCTALVEDKLFTGFPTFKFALSGIPLYDPSKDSTNGGSGSHRYNNPATWGGDGDQLPAVQAYNVLRGIRYNGAWVYGLQGMIGAARLPAANWNAQIAKCRATITGLSGPEPTYRSGGQVNINSQPANLLETLLTACQGRLSEIGGFYKIHLGAPDSATFDWSDADLLSSEQQIYRPFFSLSDSVNGIQGTYPDPAQGWETATAPALYRTDLEVRDGNRRLMANPSFDFVPYPEQVQRLQKSGIEEAQRARTHVLPMPPAYWVIEPGDVGSWDSFRNGYVSKLFRVDSVTDQPNLDCIFHVTEVDPSDYDWTHGVDYTSVSTGPTIIPRPPAQGVIDWYAEGTVLYDADGLGRRPAIRISWDPSLSGIVGVQYEVRLTADLSHVTRGRTDQYIAGALLISQGLIELTAYQVRGQYIPSSPRDMLWSDWLDVTTPELPAIDLPAWISIQVTEVFDYLNDKITEIEQRFAYLHATVGKRNWEDTQEARSQLASRTDAAFAEIEQVDQAKTAADAALAISVNSVNAKLGAGFSSQSTVAQAFVDNEVAFTEYQTTVSAQFGSVNSKVTVHTGAIAQLNGFAAASYSVTLDVNGYATGFRLVNGGVGVSSATFITDKFLIAKPGVSGGAATPIFAVANVNGSPKVAIRGDMYADGTIFASRLVAGTITSDSGVIGALSVKSLSIGNAAVTIPSAQAYSATVGTSFVTLAQFGVNIDTTGLAGQTLNLYAIGTMGINNFGTSNVASSYLQIAGTTWQQISTTNVNGISHALSYNYSFTANGGIMSFTVALVANVGFAAGGFTATGSLFAIATKR